MIIQATKETTPLSLAELPVGGAAVVHKLSASVPLTLRLLTMGLTEGTPLEVMHIAPLGDPIEISLRGYRLSLRRSDAQCVLLTEVVLP